MKIEDPDLARVMALLSAEHKSAMPPDCMEQAVMAEFDAAWTRSGMRRIVGWGAIAAMATFAVLAVRHHPVQKTAALQYTPAIHVPTVDLAAIDKKPAIRPPPERRQSSVRPETPAVAAPDTDPPEEPFFAIPYTVPLAPGERTAVVRMALSDAAFAAAGFPVAVAEPAGVRQADVLIGEDGRARAIRVVADSSFQ